MKKSLVVLLIAVLALSAVFADGLSITAKETTVSASYAVDLDSHGATYTAPSLTGKFAWTIDYSKALDFAGEGYPYIDFSIDASTAVDVLKNVKVDTTTPALTFGNPIFTVSKFEIVGEDWKINFIDDALFADYAISEIDSELCRDETKKTKAYTAIPYSTRWFADEALAATTQTTISYSNDNFGKIKLMAGLEVKAAVDATSATSKRILFTPTLDWTTPTNPKWNTSPTDSTGKVTYEELSDNVLTDDYKPLTTSATVITMVEKDFNSKMKSKTTDTSNNLIAYSEEGYKYVYTTSTSASGEILYHTTRTTIDGYNASNAKWYLEITTGTSMQEAVTTPTFIAMFESKAFDITDALSAQFAVGYAFGRSFAVSGNFTYDDVATFAFDWAGINAFDASASLKLGFVDLSGYYTTKAYLVDTTGDDDSYVQSTLKETNYLSAKAVVTLEDLGTVVTVTGKDLFKYGGSTFDIEAENTVVDGYTFTAAAKGLLDKTSKTTFSFGAKAVYEDEGLTIGAGADFDMTSFAPVVKANIAYTKEDLTLEADVTCDLDRTSPTRPIYASPEHAEAGEGFQKLAYTFKATFKAPKYDLTGGLYYNSLADKTSDYYGFYSGLHASAGISTDKLVNGAELSLEYVSGALFNTDLTSTEKLGTITAAVTVTL